LHQIKFIFPTEKKNSLGYECIIRTGLARALKAGSVEKLKDLVKSNVFFQSATDPSKQLVHTIEFLNREKILNVEQFELLTSAIGEAMLNVNHHAYKCPLSNVQIHEKMQSIVSGIGERWWQCAWYDEDNRKWVFIIADLGLGIPFTYGFQANNVRRDDAPLSNLMKEAFTRGSSRFVGVGRGNGSENIKDAVGSNCRQQESLLIYSGGVRYSYNTTQSEPKVIDLNQGIKGTLIEWTLYI